MAVLMVTLGQRLMGSAYFSSHILLQQHLKHKQYPRNQQTNPAPKVLSLDCVQLDLHRQIYGVTCGRDSLHYLFSEGRREESIEELLKHLTESGNIGITKES